MTEWDEEKVLNLIEMYKEKPGIWDPKNKDYYKRHLKFDAWAEIGVAMGTTGEECKKKMLTVLSSWRREKAKEKNSIGTGKGRNEIYESKWFAYSALNFLQDRDIPKTGLTTMECSNNEANNPDQNTEINTSKTVEPPLKKSKADPKLQMLKEAFGILKYASEKPATVQENNVENPELRSFCDFIFQKMKKYNRQTMNSVQEQIMNILFCADQSNYDYTPSYISLPQTTSNYQQSSASYTPLTVITDTTERSNYNQISSVSSVVTHPGHSTYHHPETMHTLVSPPAVTPSSLYSYSTTHASSSPQSPFSENMEDLV